jgi:membrane protein DedA with SNARE-associated domain
MGESILHFAQSIMDSPWVYLVAAGIAALDSFFPVVPSETIMITGGVFAATQGAPNLFLLMAAGAVGAVVGDHVTYGIGGLAHGPVTRWLQRGRRRRETMEWARQAIHTRGGPILLIARYVPAGRTVTTLTMGVVSFPLRRFTPWDVLAGASWAVYSSLIGYFGGHVFEDNPLYGLLLGLGVAALIGVVIEVVRRIRDKRKSREGPSRPDRSLDDVVD